MFKRKTDKQTDRNRQYLKENQTVRQKDRQIGKQTIYTSKDRQKGGQTDYQTNRHNLERQKGPVERMTDIKPESQLYTRKDKQIRFVNF